MHLLTVDPIEVSIERCYTAMSQELLHAELIDCGYAEHKESSPSRRIYTITKAWKELSLHHEVFLDGRPFDGGSHLFLIAESPKNFPSVGFDPILKANHFLVHGEKTKLNGDEELNVSCAKRYHIGMSYEKVIHKLNQDFDNWEIDRDDLPFPVTDCETDMDILRILTNEQAILNRR